MIPTAAMLITVPAIIWSTRYRMASQARKRLTSAPEIAPAIGPAIATPVMLEAMAPNIAPNRSFPSTAILRMPLRSATMPASAPIPTGIANSSELEKKTVRFAVVPFKSRAKIAKTNRRATTPSAARQRKRGPPTSCSSVVAARAAVVSIQSMMTGKSITSSVPPSLFTQNEKWPATPCASRVMSNEPTVSRAKSAARIRAALC